MIWLLPMAFAVSPPPTVTEPIARDARIDRSALRWRRPFVFASTAAPIAYGLGRYSHLSYVDRVGDAKNGAGVAGQIVGGFAVATMAAAPIGLMSQAERSRRALVRQGLSPRRIPVWIPATLSISAAVLGTTGWSTRHQRITQGHRHNGNTQTALGAASYAAAFLLPALQIGFNTTARRKAGWWAPKARR